MPILRLITFILAISMISVSAKVVVISDIDDTIKKTNSVDDGFSHAYYFLRKRVYLEMRDLYRELEKSYENFGEEVEFYYVSHTPDMFFDQERWLYRYEFPKGESRLRRLGEGDAYAYKKKVIEDILGQMSPRDTFYFFGDNSSKDPEVYRDITREMNLTNSFIFIRDVTTEATFWSGDLPQIRLEGVNYFFSEMELLERPALFFITPKLKEDILKSFSNRELIPKYHFQTLARRIEGQWGCGFFASYCLEMANREALILWERYRERF